MAEGRHVGDCNPEEDEEDREDAVELVELDEPGLVKARGKLEGDGKG